MGQKIKSHRSSPHGKNLPMEDELEFRRCIEKLRAAGNSWTELSRLFGDESPLWSRSAYNGRGLAKAADLHRARELVAALPSKEYGIMAARSKELKSRFDRICQTLLSKPYQYPLFVVAIEFLGLASAGVSAHRTSGGHPSEDAIKRGERMISMMGSGEWSPITDKNSRELTAIFNERKRQRVHDGEARAEPKAAAAGPPQVEKPNVEPPVAAVEPTNGVMSTNPFDGLIEVRAHLMAGAEKLEELTLQVPPSFRGPWTTTRDELMTFITGMDV